MKLAKFIVNKRYLILIVMIAIVIASIFTMSLVKVNYDISAYLPADSKTKIALNIMEKEFKETSSVELMATNITVAEAEQIKSDIEQMDGVLLVSFDATSRDFYNTNNNGSALLLITINGSDSSDVTTAVLLEIETYINSHEQYTFYKAGSPIANQSLQTSMVDEIPLILLVCAIIVCIILLFTSTSWLEPVIFAVVIVISIIVNMGTNYLFKEISYITKSIAAILQLGLAMDYSIMLLHRFHKEIETENDKIMAMTKALAHSFAPISSSALTTIAGLVALMFMSLTLGFDIGMVLAKGILISMICVFTVLPCLILLLDKWMQKTRKKSIDFKKLSFIKVSIKGKYIIPILGVIIICSAFIIQRNNTYFFSTTQASADDIMITNEFGKKNTVALIFEKVTTEEDYDKQIELINKIKDYKVYSGTDKEHTVLKSYTAFTNTLYDELSYKNASEMLKVDEGLIKQVYGLYYLEKNMIANPTINVSDLLDFIILLSNDEAYKELFTEENVQELNDYYTKKELLKSDVTKEEACNSLNMDSAIMDIVYSSYFDNNDSIASQINFATLINYMKSLSDASTITLSTMQKMNLNIWITLNNVINSDKTYRELSMYITTDVDIIKQIYVLYLDNQNKIPDVAIRIYKLVEFIYANSNDNVVFKSLLDDNMQTIINKYYQLVLEANQLFNGNEYSRLMLNLDLDGEDDECFNYIEYLYQVMAEVYGDDAYVVGNLTSVYELKVNFTGDLLKINLITIFAIFIIVMLTFKSLSVPMILVLLIQGAIWTSMSISYINHSSIFFMSYIVVQCLQMGATIDYGILITSSYIEQRASHPKKEALMQAIATSIPSIFTSGLILTTAGFAVGLIASHVTIYSIGLLLGRGTIISLIFVLFLLPAILLLLDKFIEKTTYKVKFIQEKDN